MNTVDNFKQLQILHGALMAGAIMISLMLGFLMKKDGAVADYTSFTSGYLPIAAAILFMEIAISFVLWNKRQSNIPETRVEAEKWLHYRSSCILRWGLIQGGTLIAVVLTYLEGNLAGFVLVAVGLAFLFLARPNRDYAAEKYGLNF